MAWKTNIFNPSIIWAFLSKAILINCVFVGLYTISNITELESIKAQSIGEISSYPEPFIPRIVVFIIKSELKQANFIWGFSLKVNTEWSQLTSLNLAIIFIAFILVLFTIVKLFKPLWSNT